MKKLRYSICILATLYLIFEAAPMLPMEGKSSATLFTITWIIFACLVLGGNLLALMKKKPRIKAIKKRISFPTESIQKQYSRSN